MTICSHVKNWNLSCDTDDFSWLILFLSYVALWLLYRDQERTAGIRILHPKRMGRSQGRGIFPLSSTYHGAFG